jgi:hypothetical protein
MTDTFDLLGVYIVPDDELLLLQRDAARGDDVCQAVAQIALGLIQEVSTGAARCACCAQRIKRGDRWLIGAVVLAGAGFLVCDSCGFAPDNLASVVAEMVGRAGPDAQYLGGTA